MDEEAPAQDEATGEPVREQGWRGPILALLAILLVPALPAARILLPIDAMLLLLAPALAVCAVAGWQKGGRWTLALLWTALALFVIWQPGASEGAYSLLVRAWGVILAITFFAVGARSWTAGRFLPRAFAALGIAGVVWVGVVAASPTGLAGAAEVYRGEVARRSQVAQDEWRRQTSSPAWVQFESRNPGARNFARDVEAQLAAMATNAWRGAAGMLALQSLAVLALAWGLYHRVGRARIGAPLARWRALRFHDAFVWPVILGLVVFVLPAPPWAEWIALNLLVFFGVLYALRGLGVLIWFLAPGRWMTVMLVVFLLFFWFVVGGVAAGIGLGDTWFDWRRRLRPKSQRSE